MNSSTRQSLEPEYFVSLYTKDPDPWRFATSEYERGKYAATLAAISGRKIRSAFEVGCSIGILTRQLAAFCESLLAIDVAQQALEQARLNCAGQSNIEFARMQIPQEWPGETFDLLVLSEILYYFCADDIRQIAHKAISSLTSGGAALLVHWTGETDYPCQGDQAVECFLDASKGLLTPLLVRREAKYRLDLLVKQD
jgi:trans-aconitate methyltransferase